MTTADSKESNSEPVPYKCDGCGEFLMPGPAVTCAQCAAEVFVCRGVTGCILPWELAETPYVCTFCMRVQGWPGADYDVAADIDADLQSMVMEDDLIEDGLDWAPDPADGDNEGADL